MTTQYLNDYDYQQYGPEMIDVSRRAAMEALSPELQRIEQQNIELQRRLAVESRRRLDGEVARAVPDYQEVDRNPRWHRWLLGIDSLSGRVRQTLLNEAISAADPARVKNFFDMFKREVGTQAPASTGTTSARPTPYAARSTPLGGRLYRRDEISKIYRQHQQGKFSEAAWQRQEADIVAAAREGRVLNAVTDINGK